MILRRISQRKPPKARSASTIGSATNGWCCSRIPRTLRQSAPPNSATWPRSSPSSTSAASRSSACPSIRSPAIKAGPTTSRRRRASPPITPMTADADFKVPRLSGMLPAAVSGDPAKRTPADNQTVRNVFVIGPDKKVKLVLVYPMTTGRNFDEVLRVIDSLQLTAKHKVATPVNWKHGEDVIIAGSVSDDDAKKQYPQGWKSPKPYIRIVPQPKA